MSSVLQFKATLDQILRSINELKRGSISAQYGTVLGVSPLQVSLDDDPATPLNGVPISLVSGLVVGDRVWTVSFRSRVIVVGRVGGVEEYSTRMVTPNTYAWKDSTVPLLVRRGSIVHCTPGGLYKASGSFTFSDAWASFGALIPAGFAPKNHINHPAEVVQNDRPYIATLWISPSGVLIARTAIDLTINEDSGNQALILPSMTWEAPTNLPT